MHQAAISIPPASLKRQLAHRPLKKGSSMERVAFWHQQHPGRTEREFGVNEDVRFVTTYVRTPEGIVPNRRITRVGHQRVDAAGAPRSKVYDRRGKR